MPGQLAVASFLVPLLLVGTWFLLHHRRLAVVDASAKTLQILYGKPWLLWRTRHPFSDFDSLTIQVVPRARFTVHRVVAVGQKGQKLVTFTFSADAAAQCADNIARETGWKRNP